MGGGLVGADNIPGKKEDALNCRGGFKASNSGGFLVVNHRNGLNRCLAKPVCNEKWFYPALPERLGASGASGFLALRRANM